MLHWWREAANVLHWHVVRIIQTEVFVQHGKDLVVENLELADAVNHLLQRLTNATHQQHIICQHSLLSVHSSVSTLLSAYTTCQHTLLVSTLLLSADSNDSTLQCQHTSTVSILHLSAHSTCQHSSAVSTL